LFAIIQTFPILSAYYNKTEYAPGILASFVSCVTFDLYNVIRMCMIENLSNHGKINWQCNISCMYCKSVY